MQIRHLLFLVGLTTLLAFSITGGWHFWVRPHLGNAGILRDASMVDRWQYVVVATGAALFALIIPVWSSARAITARNRAQAALKGAQETLEHQVEERTAELENAYADLKAEIAQYRRTQNSLRNSEACLQSIMDNAPVEIHLKDAEGRYVLINKQCEKLWGVTGNEVIGKLPSEVPHPGDLAQAVRAHDLLVLNTGEAIEQEHEVLLNDGLRTIRFIKFPIHGDSGQITGLGAVAIDVTRQKRAEEALVTSKQEAEFASRAKSDFLASMSHELRTPLNAIIGFSELIKVETFGPVGNAKYLDYVGDIYWSGQHLLKLINDLLDLRKIESGKDELHEEAVDVGAAVQSAIKLVQQRGEEGKIELSADLEEGLPALWADRRKLTQILVNLLSNAVKFTKAGGRATLKVWWRENSGFVFQMIDTGVGIAPEDIPKALSQFTQVDGDLYRRQEGTGLGLPLTKALAELHGGSLDLQSQVGVGTTVTVRFPASRIVASAQEAPAIASERRAAG